MKMWNGIRAVAFAALVVASATAPAQTTKPAESAAPYVPTPWVIVDEIMKLAAIEPSDFVVDLGSGDGRLVITAVSKHGARGGMGVDIQPDLVQLANDNAKAAGVGDRVRFVRRDLFETPVGDATLVTLYLLPTTMPKVESKLLQELQAGARVVAHDYPFPDWPPERVVRMDVPEKVAVSGTTRTALYLYTVPARVAGDWTLSVRGQAPLRLSIAQTAAGASASVTAGTRALPVPEFRVHGATVSLRVPAAALSGRPLALTGRAHDGVLEGTAEDGRTWRAERVRG